MSLQTRLNSLISAIGADMKGKLDAAVAPELVRDTVAATLQAGANITIVYNDAADTITITAEGGGQMSTFVPCPKPPVGLTLRYTYQTSQTPTKTAWPEDVYVVAVGGGGSGAYGSNYTTGGGGGACAQGWMKSADIGSITIGAGGANPGSPNLPGLAGSPTLVGSIIAPGGGGGGGVATTPGGNQIALNVGPGAGQGGMASGAGISYSSDHLLSVRTPEPLYGMFSGGLSGIYGSPTPSVTSGAGGSPGAPRGGDGYQGPGGGGSASTQGTGGSSISPNGSTYAGVTGTSSIGGGGAGILGSGTGQAGGPGGGGGGASLSAAGAGGAGAVLIYW